VTSDRDNGVRTSRRSLSPGIDDRRSRTIHDAEGAAGALVVAVDGVDRIEAEHGATGLAEVLRVAGHRIRLSLRADDFTARWGGEELVVVLRNVSLDSAVDVGQRLRVAVSQPITLHDGRSLVPTCSVGAASGDPDRVEETIERARVALLLAVDGGGNCVRRALPAEDRGTAGVTAGR
jgi:diguanylate cyclase (GGDEF)-like protein